VGKCVPKRSIADSDFLRICCAGLADSASRFGIRICRPVEFTLDFPEQAAIERGMGKGKQKGFSTRAVHGGRGFTGNTGAVMPPVYMTSTFAQGNADGFDYTRSGNPNFRLLEASLAFSSSQCVAPFVSQPYPLWYAPQ
jgi:hypothetical protein